jgi:hypothetical protein
MMALLYAHPNVYVDIAGLQSPMITPRAGYLWYVQRLVDSGFAARIMFGSDFPNQMESGIKTIVDTTFLSAEQKADILCGHAARFLRLSASVCALRAALSALRGRTACNASAVKNRWRPACGCLMIVCAVRCAAL